MWGRILSPSPLFPKSGSPDLLPSSCSCPGSQARFQNPVRAVGLGPEGWASSMQEVGGQERWQEAGVKKAPQSCRGFLPGLPCLQRSSLLVGQEVGERCLAIMRSGPGQALGPCLPFIFTSFLLSRRAKGLTGGRPNPSPASRGQTGSDGFLTEREH